VLNTLVLPDKTDSKMMNADKTLKQDADQQTLTEQQIWSVYLIRTRLNTLYAGVTTDVERRFKEHASNSKKGARYLRGKGPLALMWHQAIGDKREAMSLEYKIKQMDRKKKLSLIHGSLTLDDIFGPDKT
jgi:putative endonuclease